jgi:hypothetical protein
MKKIQNAKLKSADDAILSFLIFNPTSATGGNGGFGVVRLNSTRQP